jgi:SAM-dependent methyltransferase
MSDAEDNTPQRASPGAGPGGADPDGPGLKGLQRAYRTGRYHARVFSAEPFVQDVLARRRARKLQRLIAPGETVFEYGVGTGLNLRHLPCAERVGYDISDAAAGSCREFGIEHVTDLSQLGRRRFSVVLCHHVLEHVPDPLATLETLGGLVANGGWLILYVPFECTRRYRRYHPDDPNRHLFSWNCLTLGNLVAAAGMTVERVGVRAYGYEQRLARLAKAGMATYRLALWLARLLRPCDEIELVARPQ